MRTQISNNKVFFLKEKYESLKGYSWAIGICSIGFIVYSFEFTIWQITPYIFLIFLIGGRGELFYSFFVKKNTCLEFKNDEILINDIRFDTVDNLEKIQFVTKTSRFNYSKPKSSLRIKTKTKFRILINFINYEDVALLKTFFRQQTYIVIEHKYLEFPIV